MRVGMIRRQNKDLTSALVMAICAEAEGRWHLLVRDNAREELKDMVVFMLATLGAGLRGEDMPLISLDGLLTFWDESRLDTDSHIMLILQGRFKGEVDERWHLVPISNATRLGLPVRKWMEQVLHRRINLQGQETGWLFQDRRGAWCDNILSGYLSVVTTVFSQQDGIYGFKFPKRFLEISSRDLTLFFLLSILII